MEWLLQIADFFLHLDHHIKDLLEHFGGGTYIIVFLIIFCETGLVVTPFLPGDSLLFILGTFAATGALNIIYLLALLLAAAILGNTLNYAIGRKFAPKVFGRQRIRFVKEEYLEKTERFFEKYGGKTIIITRFVPIIRSFAPFLAGVGQMNYGRFTFYNVSGGILWVCSLTLAGYFFGNIPIVQKHFTLVVYLIIVVSLLPAVLEFLRHRQPKVLE